MKTKMILVSLLLAACGRPQTTSAVKEDLTASATTSLCKVYASSEDLSAFKTVQPIAAQLSDMEKSMIQTSVLVSGHDAPLTPDEAIDIFSDKENGGSLGGEISYYKMTINGKEKTLASVVYYPGDNEYGALFQIWTYGDGAQSSSLIGTVGDSDVYCLQYTE